MLSFILPLVSLTSFLPFLTYFHTCLVHILIFSLHPYFPFYFHFFLTKAHCLQKQQLPYFLNLYVLSSILPSSLHSSSLTYSSFSSPSPASFTHSVWLVHLDGHLVDGICRLVDHSEKSGAAQSLSADRPRQLDNKQTNWMNKWVKLNRLNQLIWSFSKGIFADILVRNLVFWSARIFIGRWWKLPCLDKFRMLPQY